jgi:hypothetical protein
MVRRDGLTLTYERDEVLLPSIAMPASGQIGLVGHVEATMKKPATDKTDDAGAA